MDLLSYSLLKIKKLSAANSKADPWDGRPDTCLPSILHRASMILGATPEEFYCAGKGSRVDARLNSGHYPPSSRGLFSDPSLEKKPART